MPRRLRAAPLALAGLAALLATAVAGRAGEELPPELKRDLDRLTAQVASLEDRAARLEVTAVEQSVKEITGQLKEFAVDAELPDDDAQIKRLKTRLAAALERSKKAEGKRTADAAAKAAARAKEDVPERDLGEEIKGMVSIKRDLNNVSFKRDVAPIIQNVCVRCHANARASGNFNASTFEGFMTQIEPGKPADSHVLNLVTGKSEPRMPRGAQTRFDREWVNIWTAWIKQGAKFDGPNPKAALSTYLIDFDQQRREAIAALPDKELEKLHRTHAERQWSIVGTAKPVATHETPNFLVRTTLPKEDAEYVAVLAEATLEDLLKRYAKSDASNYGAWRGRFGVNVFADRADYVAFARGVDTYAPESWEFAHNRNNAEHQYLAMTTEKVEGSLDGLLAHQVASAFFKTLGDRKMPPWAVHGLATAAALKASPKDAALRGEVTRGAQLLQSGKGLEHFVKEDLPWLELAPLAAHFFNVLETTDAKKAASLAKALAKHGNATQALAAVGVDSRAVQAGWKAGGGRRR